MVTIQDQLIMINSMCKILVMWDMMTVVVMAKLMGKETLMCLITSVNSLFQIKESMYIADREHKDSLARMEHKFFSEKVCIFLLHNHD